MGRLRPDAEGEGGGLRPDAGGLAPKVAMTDRELIQLICAYRLLDEEVELSLSMRESPVFRDHAVRAWECFRRAWAFLRFCRAWVLWRRFQCGLPCPP